MQCQHPCDSVCECGPSAFPSTKGRKERNRETPQMIEGQQRKENLKTARRQILLKLKSSGGGEKKLIFLLSLKPFFLLSV